MQRAEGPASTLSLVVALAGLVVTGVALVAATGAARTGTLPAPDITGYLVVWVPLVLALVVWALATRPPSVRDALGLHIAAIDLLWAIAAAVLCRVVAIFALAAAGVHSGVVPTPGAWTVIAAVLLGPLVEELFFRGLLLRSLAAFTRTRSGLVAVVVLQALAFSALHALSSAGSTSLTLVQAVTTFAVGLAMGAIATATGRIGGAVVGHALANALALVGV